MKLSISNYAFLFFIFISFFSIQAQHIDIDKEALSFLKEADTIQTIFTYENLLIDNDVTEHDFLNKMNVKIVRFGDEAMAGRWQNAYKDFKEDKWQTTFVNFLNERNSKFEHTPIFKINTENKKYTMKVNAYWMYYGYDAGIIDRPAKVSLTITFYETNHPDTILFETNISRAMGKYNKTDGDGENRGPSLNRMNKAYKKAAFKFSQALKRVLD